MKTQHHAQNPNGRSTRVRTHCPSTFHAGMSRTGKTSLLKRALCLGLCVAITTPAFAQSGVTFTRITVGDLVTDSTLTAEACLLGSHLLRKLRARATAESVRVLKTLHRTLLSK